jgi:hypothetical protein
MTIEITVKRTAGVYAADRETLADWLGQAASRGLASGADRSAPLLTVTMICGGIRTYRRLSDLPTESDRCTCGDPTHFFIWYDA